MPPVYVAGQRLAAADLNQVTGFSAYVREDTVITGITGTSFAAGTPVCGLTFTGPSGGSVKITLSALLKTTGTVSRNLYLSSEVRTGTTIGSGTSVLAAADSRSLRIDAGANSTSVEESLQADYSILLTGLTSGSSYNIQTVHKVNTGTGVVAYRTIWVEPWFG